MAAVLEDAGAVDPNVAPYIAAASGNVPRFSDMNARRIVPDGRVTESPYHVLSGAEISCCETAKFDLGVIMFEPGRVYRRKELHDLFGGSRQSGISPSASHRLVLLFTGETGEQYGYHDGWSSDGTFRYSGEGQTGDMTFSRGNKAIRDHAENGKELHLFERTGKGFVRYVGQMDYAGHDIITRVQDRDKGLRSAIVFRLSPVGPNAIRSGSGSARGTRTHAAAEQ